MYILTLFKRHRDLLKSVETRSVNIAKIKTNTKHGLFFILLLVHWFRLVLYIFIDIQNHTYSWAGIL